MELNTFSLPGGEVVEKRIVAPQLGQGGMQGGNIGPARGTPRQTIDTSTTDLLMKLGDSILRPAIEQRQAEAYLEGAQRVMQGEALTDIINEQPWYTKIFGPASSVQGARAVAQMRGVDSYITDLYNDMPALAQRSTEDVGKEANQRMASYLTGDKITDAAIQVKMLESSAPFFKAHAKAHYKWTQDTMQKQVVGLSIGAAGQVQAAAKGYREGVTSEEDFTSVKMAALNTLKPLDGQSPESYWSAVEEATIDAMANGNHHFAAEVFSSGVFQHAPAEQRRRMLDARRTYENQTKQTLGFLEYGARIGQLEGQARSGLLSSKQIAQEVVAINEDFRRLTGIESDLFDRKTFSSLISANFSKIVSRNESIQKENRRYAREDAKAQAKIDAEVRKQTALAQGILGFGGDMLQIAGFTGQDIQRGTLQTYEAIKARGGSGEAFLAETYNRGGAHVNSVVANQIQSQLRAAKMEGYGGMTFDAAHQRFMELANASPAAALAYAGQEDGVRMLKYNSLTTSGIDPTVAYQAAFGEPIDTTRSSTDKEIREKISTYVEDDQPGALSRLFLNRTPLSDSSQRVAATSIGRHYDLLTQNLGFSDEAAIKVAHDLSKREIDYLGAFAIPKGGVDRPSFQALVGADEDTAAELFMEAVVRKGKDNGVTVDLSVDRMTAGDAYMGALLPNYHRNVYDLMMNRKKDPTTATDVTVVRMPDQVLEDGSISGQYAVTTVTEDGLSAQFVLTTDEIRKAYEQSDKFK